MSLPSFYHPPYNPFTKGRVPSYDPCYGLKYGSAEFIKLNFVVAVLFSLGIMTYQLVSIAHYFPWALFQRAEGLPLWTCIALECLVLVCFVFRETYDWAVPRAASMTAPLWLCMTYWSVPIWIIAYISLSHLAYCIAGADTPE